MHESKCLLITGASGYIGKYMLRRALENDYGVKALVRSPEKISHDDRVEVIRYDMRSPPEAAVFANISAVIHLAANTKQEGVGQETVELNAVRDLLFHTKDSGVKFIFVSSQAAAPDAPTQYGKVKWEIEQEVLAAGGYVVRPGQVYGGKEEALFGMIVALVRRLPVLPRFIPSPMVQPIHVDDLAEGMIRIVEDNALVSGIYSMASSVPVSFDSFLASVAEHRIRAFRLFCPVPVVFISFVSLILGDALSQKLGLQRLKSLFELKPMETESDLLRLGLALRPLSSGMHPSGDGRRRALLIEGRSILSYLNKGTVNSSVVRRYVRAVEAQRGGMVLGFPSLFSRIPSFISLLDNGDSTGELAWRLDAATLLLEATPEGADRFMRATVRSKIATLLDVIRLVLSEALWGVMKIATIYWRRKIMKKAVK